MNISKPTLEEVVREFVCQRIDASGCVTDEEINADLAKHGYGSLTTDEIREILDEPSPESMEIIGPVIARFLKTHNAKNLAELCVRWNMNGDEVWRQAFKEARFLKSD